MVPRQCISGSWRCKIPSMGTLETAEMTEQPIRVCARPFDLYYTYNNFGNVRHDSRSLTWTKQHTAKSVQ